MGREREREERKKAMAKGGKGWGREQEEGGRASGADRFVPGEAVAAPHPL